MSTAIARMRQQASISAKKTRQSILKDRLTEEVYQQTIAELEGQSFQPLAGITVTFGKPYATSSLQGEPDNAFVRFDYVEYTTGFRLTMIAVVELDKDYLPIGVERKALYDATYLKLEEILNSCGYTVDSEPSPGLRGVTNLKTGNDHLSIVFELDKYLHQFYFDARLDLTERLPMPSVQFEETDTHVIFRLPSTGVLLSHSQYSPFSHEVAGLPMALLPVSELGVLATLKGQRVWKAGDERLARGDSHEVTPVTQDEIPDVYTGKWDDIYSRRDFDGAYDFLETESEIVYDLPYSRALDVRWENGCLVLEYPKNWLEVEINERATLTIANPSRWVKVVARRVEDRRTCVKKKENTNNSIYRASASVKDSGYSINLKELVALRDALQLEVLEVKPEPTVEPIALEVKPEPTVEPIAVEPVYFEADASKLVTPVDSFLTRVGRAFRAFRSELKKP